MLDYSCDAYKEMKEMSLCGFRGRRKALKTAESDYEYSLGRSYDPPRIPKNKFDVAKEMLEREDL